MRLRRYFLVYLTMAMFGGFLLPTPSFALISPNDPYVNSNSWWWGAIGAPEAWQTVTKGSERPIIVAVIDGGTDISNPYIKDSIWSNPDEILNNIDDDKDGFVDDINGWDFYEGDPVVTPLKVDVGSKGKAYHHGTLVSGIINAVANAGFFSNGMNRNVKIMPIRALDDNGSGSIEDVTKAIYYAMRHGADVINLSLVTDQFDKTFQVAVSDAYRAGVVVVGAVGNNGEEQRLTQRNGLSFGENLSYPVCFDAESQFPFILGVGSVDINEKIASFSNYGKCLDIMAPGVRISSTGVYPGDPVGAGLIISNLSGTSISAPFVSGAAALIKSAFPYLKNDAIIASILDGARQADGKNPAYAGYLGKGILDLPGALKKAGSFVPKNLIYTMHEEAGKAIVQSFDSGFALRNKFNTGIAYKDILSWEVFDFDRDGQDNVIIAAQKGKNLEVSIFGGGSAENVKSFVVLSDAKPRARAAGIVGAKIFSIDIPSATYAGSLGGVGVAFADKSGADKSGKVSVGVWGPDARRLYRFDTALKSDLALTDVDAYWSRQDDRIMLAHIEEAGVRLFSYDALGNLFDAEFKTIPNPLQKGELKQMKFMFKNIRGNAARDSIRFSMPGKGAALSIDEVDGALGRVEFSPFSENFLGGLDVAVGDFYHDGRMDVVVSNGKGAPPLVRIFGSDGKIKDGFRPVKVDYLGGVQVRVTD